MPNHVHAILVLVGTPFLASAAANDVGTPFLASAATDAQKRVPTLGMVIGNYKAGVTRLARQRGVVDNNTLLWQSRYHDHIIRDEASLSCIRAYVQDNPARWAEDTFYTEG